MQRTENLIPLIYKTSWIFGLTPKFHRSNYLLILIFSRTHYFLQHPEAIIEDAEDWLFPFARFILSIGKLLTVNDCFPAVVRFIQPPNSSWTSLMQRSKPRKNSALRISGSNDWWFISNYRPLSRRYSTTFCDDNEQCSSMRSELTGNSEVTLAFKFTKSIFKPAKNELISCSFKVLLCRH